MPAYLTHRAAGERVYSRMGWAVKNKMAFYLGCQGPDILFFRNYQPWRSSKKSVSLAKAMHGERTRELLTHALEFIKSYDGEDKDELVSYIYGFLTHYSIDRNAHPFVYSKAGTDTSVHNATEYMWDSYISEEQWGIEPHKFDISSEVMYGRICKGIREWYSSAAEYVYGGKLKAVAIRQAQLHLAKAKKTLGHLKVYHKVLAKVILKITGFDILKLRYPKHRNESLFSREEYSDMQNLILKGVEEAVNMIELAFKFIDGAIQELPSWFGDTNFAGETFNFYTC